MTRDSDSESESDQKQFRVTAAKTHLFGSLSANPARAGPGSHESDGPEPAELRHGVRVTVTAAAELKFHDMLTQCQSRWVEFKPG